MIDSTRLRHEGDQAAGRTAELVVEPPAWRQRPSGPARRRERSLDGRHGGGTDHRGTGRPRTRSPHRQRAFSASDSSRPARRRRRASLTLPADPRRTRQERRILPHADGGCHGCLRARRAGECACEGGQREDSGAPARWTAQQARRTGPVRGASPGARGSGGADRGGPLPGVWRPAGGGALHGRLPRPRGRPVLRRRHRARRSGRRRRRHLRGEPARGHVRPGMPRRGHVPGGVRARPGGPAPGRDRSPSTARDRMGARPRSGPPRPTAQHRPERDGARRRPGRARVRG